MISFMKSILTIVILFSGFSFKLISQPINPWTPPEYYPAKGVLIEWDFNYNIWPLYSELIYECQEVVDVILIVNNQNEENTMQNLLENDNVPLDNIHFVHVPTERMWVRDHGPISVMTDTGVAFMDLIDLANSGVSGDLPTNLANLWGLDSYDIPYILCGGNFMINSNNTLFTTDRLYTNNPEVPEASIQQDLQSYMGINEIITFSAMHDDYWGHIDMQLKLLNDSTAVISSVDQGSGPDYNILENNYDILASHTTPTGGEYTIAKILKAENWKTYANSLILNNKVIVPIYDNYRDTLALQTYQNLLPDHNIVGINTNSIIHWGGAIHCITMQLFDDEVVTRIKEMSVKEKGFSIYPNPAKSGSYVNIICSTDKGNLEKIAVYDISGKEFYSKTVSGQSQPYKVLMQKSGVYIINVVYDNGSYLTRIIIVL